MFGVCFVPSLFFLYNMFVVSFGNHDLGETLVVAMHAIRYGFMEIDHKKHSLMCMCI